MFNETVSTVGSLLQLIRITTQIWVEITLYAIQYGISEVITQTLLWREDPVVATLNDTGYSGY